MYDLYSNIFLYSVTFLTLVVAMTAAKKSYAHIVEGSGNGYVFAFVLSICYAIWLGHRPPTYVFADTGNYAWSFYLMQTHQKVVDPDASEWVWNQFTYACSQVMDVSMYFTIIALGYFLCTFYCCYLLTKRNVLVSLLFLMGAFSFFSYGVNGLRNGLACALVLVVIALLSQPKRNVISAAIIAFIAINIHKSVLLPLFSVFVALYFVKSFKMAYTVWIMAIVISLIAGSALSSFFAGLGFDDRLSYLTARNDIYTKTGFRWDFLVYSMMPIVLGYYIVIKRGIRDCTYELLLNTYTIANAFWVMIIRANYSNRFAYLSWFMYPLVLAYPLLKLNVWDNNQGKRLVQIMLAHIGFTWVMAKLL